MNDWPLKHDGPCKCRFVRKEEFGLAEQVEWCSLHAKQRDEIANLRAFVASVHYRMKFGSEITEATRLTLIDACEKEIPELANVSPNARDQAPQPEEGLR